MAGATAASIHEALEALLDLDNDFSRFVVDIAAEVAQRVDAEDASSGDETYAAAIVRGLLGDPSEEYLATTALNLCALEWRINEQGVRDFLDL